MAPAHLVATTKSCLRPVNQRPRISSVRPTRSRPPPERVDVGGVDEGDPGVGGRVEYGS